MKRHGKNYLEKVKVLSEGNTFDVTEAVQKLKAISFAKFDETVELHFNLGIDPRHSDQQIRGTLTLPHGTGRSVKIAVVASADKLAEAQQAGADEVGAEDFIEKIQAGYLDFDLLITTPDMMAKVGKLGKVLGAKGLMPNPKNGTVTPNVASAVKEFKLGKIEYRNDKAGIVHVAVGKKSFEDKNLKENIMAVVDAVIKAKPAKSKGIYMKSISLCSTMSPGVFLDTLKLRGKEA